jgi:tRNA A37 methylthiotransferase MiaB
MEPDEQGTKEKLPADRWLEDLKGRRIYLETYGCRYNFGDTAKLIEILKAQGNTFADSVEDAEAVILNTCTVVGSSERRMLRRLANLKDQDLYVTGCMPAVQREAILAVCSPTIIPHKSIHDLYSDVGTITPQSVGIVQVRRAVWERVRIVSPVLPGAR